MALKINRTITIISRIVGWGLIIAIVVYFGKTYIWEQEYYRTKSAEKRSTAQAVITQIPEVKAVSTSEISSQDYEDHRVEVKNPRYIKIDRLKIDTIVKSANVDTSSSLPVPGNINESVWYSASAKPGNAGVTLITGISDYNGQSAIFKNLDSLEKGDSIVVENGQGDEYVYIVEKISMSSKKDASKTIPQAQQAIDNKATLTLISINNSESTIVIVKSKIKE